MKYNPTITANGHINGVPNFICSAPEATQSGQGQTALEATQNFIDNNMAKLEDINYDFLAQKINDFPMSMYLNNKYYMKINPVITKRSTDNTRCHALGYTSGFGKDDLAAVQNFIDNNKLKFSDINSEFLAVKIKDFPMWNYLKEYQTDTKIYPTITVQEKEHPTAPTRFICSCEGFEDGVSVLNRITSVQFFINNNKLALHQLDDNFLNQFKDHPHYKYLASYNPTVNPALGNIVEVKKHTYKEYKKEQKKQRIFMLINHIETAWKEGHDFDVNMILEITRKLHKIFKTWK